MSNPQAFDCWVNENNPSEEKNFRKGWWDHIEDIRRLSYLTGPGRIEVIGELLITTPPPQEELLLPVVRLIYPGFSIEIAIDFSLSGFYPEYLVSLELLVDQALSDSSFSVERTRGYMHEMAVRNPWFKHLGMASPADLENDARERFSKRLFMPLGHDSELITADSQSRVTGPVWSRESIYALILFCDLNIYC